MASITEVVHEALRSWTGTTLGYVEDWHAYLTINAIPLGMWNERILAFAKTFNSAINDAGAAHNYFLYNPTLLSGSFYAPLTTSIVPSVGTGSATFTRATTATVTDFEGLNKVVKSGEARFVGARRVENLCSVNTENSSAWIGGASGTAVTPVATNNYGVAPDGTNTAIRVVANLGVGGASAATNSSYFALSNVAATNIMRSIWIKSNTGDNQVIVLNQNSIEWTITATTTWQRVCKVGTASNSTLTIGNRGTAPGGQDVVDILTWHPQAELITGQTNTNPSEYVSNGVLSAPWHGANVDGVKYFDYLNPNVVV